MIYRSPSAGPRPTRPRSSRHRFGAAAVEMACVTPLMLVILIGIWECGRLIQVQQIMQCAARDAARLAAQANIIATNGAYTQINFNTGSPNVDQTIRSYLAVSGITNQTGVTTAFTLLDGSGNPISGQPLNGTKNQRFRITITVPYDNVRWTNLGIVNPTTLSVSVDWQMLVDDPFSVDTALPGWSP